MLTDRPEASVYLACAHTDMRKSINGLVVNPLAYLQYVFEQLPNVYSGPKKLNSLKGVM